VRGTARPPIGEKPGGAGDSMSPEHVPRRKMNPSFVLPMNYEHLYRILITVVAFVLYVISCTDLVNFVSNTTYSEFIEELEVPAPPTGYCSNTWGSGSDCGWIATMLKVQRIITPILCAMFLLSVSYYLMVCNYCYTTELPLVQKQFRDTHFVECIESHWLVVLVINFFTIDDDATITAISDEISDNYITHHRHWDHIGIYITIFFNHPHFITVHSRQPRRRWF
jgi:hypothetical protein